MNLAIWTPSNPSTSLETEKKSVLETGRGVGLAFHEGGHSSVSVALQFCVLLPLVPAFP